MPPKKMLPKNYPSRESHSADVIARRKRIAQAYLRGETQQAIADREKISQPMVSKELTSIREQWKKDAATSIDEKVVEELNRIAHIETEAWNEWEKSKKDNEGNPRGAGTQYMQIVCWAVEQRIKIFGIGKDKTKGAVTVTINWDDLLDPPTDPDPIEEAMKRAALPLKVENVK